MDDLRYFGEFERKDGEHPMVAELAGLHADSIRIWQVAKTGQDVGELVDLLAAKAAVVLANADEHADEIESLMHMRVREAERADAVLHASIRRHWHDNLKDEPPLDKLDISELENCELLALSVGPVYLTGISERLQRKIQEALWARLDPKHAEQVKDLRLAKARALQALTALSNMLAKRAKAKRIGA